MKDIFSLFIFEVDFAVKIEYNIYLLFVDLKLKTKQDPLKERTNLSIFRKFIKKNY